MSDGLFLGTYDPQQVVVSLDDTPIIGFADGDAIVVEKNEDFSSETVGIKGEVSRAINRDRTGTLTITLQHNSPSVAQIEAMAHAEYPPVVKVSVADPSSVESFASTQAWLKTDASHAFGDEVGTREYTFFLTTVRKGNFIANFATDLAFGLGSNAVKGLY